MVLIGYSKDAGTEPITSFAHGVRLWAPCAIWACISSASQAFRLIRRNSIDPLAALDKKGWQLVPWFRVRVPTRQGGAAVSSQ